MIKKSEIALIEKYLSEKIINCNFLKETSRSYLYRITGQNEYIFKKGKNQKIEEEYNNQRKIYDIWKEHEPIIEFKIAQPICYINENNAYIMEYVKNSDNLLDVIFARKPGLNDLFFRVGQALLAYHSLVTKRLANYKQNMFEYNTVSQILPKRTHSSLKNLMAEFPEDSYRIIFKDFTPSNIIVGKDGNIYFTDFQKIYYYSPFYYDLARFIDTTKVFCFIKKPFFFLLKRKAINSAIEKFLSGYGCELKDAYLEKMCRFHRAEHIQMKVNSNKLSALILKMIYKFF